MLLVDLPHAFQPGEDEPIDHRSRRLQYADDPIRCLGVRFSARGQAVRAGKYRVARKARAARDLCAQNRFERSLPQAP